MQLWGKCYQLNILECTETAEAKNAVLDSSFSSSLNGDYCLFFSFSRLNEILIALFFPFKKS